MFYAAWPHIGSANPFLIIVTTINFFYLPFSACAEGEMCRPSVLSPTSKGGPYLRIISGKHPCVSQTYSGEEFIPNDVVIEGQRLCTLVTGPNMGGKSTLMRQAGLIIILAQLVKFFS